MRALPFLGLLHAAAAGPTSSSHHRFPVPEGGRNDGGAITVSFLPFLPVDQNITLSLTDSGLAAGTWSTPPQDALYERPGHKSKRAGAPPRPTFHGDESQHRRGCDVDILWRRVAAFF